MTTNCSKRIINCIILSLKILNFCKYFYKSFILRNVVSKYNISIKKCKLGSLARSMIIKTMMLILIIKNEY